MYEERERQIRARIGDTRERLGETIEEIGDRVNPDRLQRELKSRAREEVDDFKHTVKQKARHTMRDVEHGVKDRGRNLWETIKDNPIPAAMVGAGVAWLMANGSSKDHDRAVVQRRHWGTYPDSGGYPSQPSHGVASRYRGPLQRSESDEQYPEAARLGYEAGYATATRHESPGRAPSSRPEARRDEHGVGETARAAAEQVRERTEHATEQAKHAAEDAVEWARDKGSELMDRPMEGVEEARHRVEDWAAEAQERARRAEHRVEDAVRQHPMAAGMVAAALGFAAGLMIPETDKEHELMGPARDRLLDRAQETASRAADSARDAAKQAASASAERAVDELWSGGEDSGDAPSGMSGPGRGA
jgi:ElaB/YqjD/DUF883 family membrane-anchored ribosome-binding protein